MYEADMSFLLGNNWHLACQKARQQDLLNFGQYGGCPGKEARTVNLIEELRHDVSQLTITPFTNFDNNADSCYD